MNSDTPRATSYLTSQLVELTEGRATIRDFISALMHETAQPVAAIIALCAGLKSLDSELTRDERARYIEDIENQARYLQELSRWLRAPNELVPLRADTLLNEIVENSRPLAQKHRIKVEIDVGKAMVVADKLPLEAIIRNLIQNAADYSPDGGIIKFHARVDVDMLRVDITDQGPGIPREEWERIFEQYERLESDETTDPGAHGIGLFIARRTAQQFLGNVRVSSSSEKGSTFTLELPLS